MTGGEKTRSLLSGTKAVCIPDASCLSQQHFLFGEPTGSNETELPFFDPSRLTAAASHDHLPPLAPGARQVGELGQRFED